MIDLHVSHSPHGSPSIGCSQFTAFAKIFATVDEVKGQDHIVTTLKNQIRNHRLGHAYLFCGTRGTGKTTVAKILAMH